MSLDMSCPEPFLAESLYPDQFERSSARWCREMPSTNISCCLPCPAASWRYPNEHSDTLNHVSWLAILSLVLMIVLLVTFAVLPAKTSGRHYLTISPAIGLAFMVISYIIPLGASVEQCHDDITANDLQSDLTCAFSGASLLYGVWVVVLGCFFRSLSIYLYVGWEKELAKKYMITSLVTIFGGSIGLLALVLVVSGVSYQYGNVCYINPEKSRYSFWGLLLAVAAATLLLQVLTMAYCTYVTVKPAYQNWVHPRVGYQRASLDSQPTIRTRDASVRVRKLIQMQWRAIAITFLLVVHCVLLAAVLLGVADFADYTVDDLMPWITCLVLSEGDKMKCAPEASKLGPSEVTLLASFIMLILIGVWPFMVIARRSMLTGWVELLKKKSFIPPFIRSRFSKQANNHEKYPSLPRYVDSGSFSGNIPLSPTRAKLQDSINSSQADERLYTIPKRSFSAPIPPRWEEAEGSSSNNSLRHFST